MNYEWIVDAVLIGSIVISLLLGCLNIFGFGIHTLNGKFVFNGCVYFALAAFTVYMVYFGGIEFVGERFK